jgi:hypothetical protein
MKLAELFLARFATRLTYATVFIPPTKKILGVFFLTAA